MEKFYHGFRIKIYPTDEQKDKLNIFLNARILYWNLGVEVQKELLAKDEKILKLVELKAQVMKLLEADDYEWTRDNGVPTHMIHFTLSDVNTAFNRYLKKLSGIPRFKSVRDHKKSFVQRNDMKQFSKGKVQINKLGSVSCDDNSLQRAMRETGKVVRPTVSYDGLDYFFSLSIEGTTQTINSPKTEALGIDVGIRDLMTLSDGSVVHNRNNEIQHLIRRHNLISKRLGDIYHIRGKSSKSKNTIKLERELLKVTNKIKNFQDTHIMQSISDIICRNPEYVAMEELKLSNMVKNKNLSYQLNQSKFRFMRDQMEYQCRKHGIPFHLVGSKFPSTKLCSNCGEKNDPKTSKTYTCKHCGIVIDRDLNASINIRDQFK